ncbi:DVU0298 family protein [Desulfohalovibrio reitneri]|uniref:DVU0298 family protein n=1 Tax=Desulfohalovibrio reitneri TaxID=1307759 RepID=UPI0005565CF0|nr:DVU0298 family protein [Desulfohalovibrio reitneri]
MPKVRKAKDAVEAILADANWSERLGELDSLGLKRVSGALFSLILSPSPALRWRARKAFGKVAADLDASEPEAGRTIVRNMLWRLNEESGGIGWGVPEAMGEVLAASPRLAEQYHSILLSYVREHDGVCHGNFLDNPGLRHGVLRGLVRLAEARPELVARGAAHLTRVLDPGLAAERHQGSPEQHECHDARARALACRALGLAAGNLSGQALETARSALEAMLDDRSETELEGEDGIGEQTTVAAEAQRALDTLTG